MRIPETTKGKGLALAGLAVAAAVIFVLYRKFFPHFDLQQLLDDFANLLGAWTYVVIAVLSFLETGAFVGLLVPGETALLVGGAVAGQGVINLYLLIAIAWICAVLGDSVSFYLGHRLGREFIIKHGSRVGITPERYHQVEVYFEKHGGKTVLIGRFLGLIRALSPFVAGSSGMRYRAFIPYSVLGSGLQVTLHIMAGYLFARSIDAAAEYVGLVALIVGTVIVVSVIGVVGFRFLRVPENRVKLVAGMEENRAGRWLVNLGRRLRPQWDWLVARLTPGGAFGLEVTTLLSIIAVSSFIVVAYTEIILGDGGPTPGDLTAFDFVDAIRTGWMVDIAQVITDLGSTPVIIGLTAITGTFLYAGRKWAELAVLLLATVAIYVGVDVLKETVDRPRPSGALTGYSNASFPSGHAAHSVFYVWLAVTIAVRLRPNMARKTALVLTGIAISALIGLSRVFLSVHYLSDVNAGWALGAFCFAFFAVAALLTGQLRKN
ncbi:MAG TPA: bifunctional DedA family/phosphatase PAP2 family protein [Solirubrobacterales bacterium]|nr:bifunctional DedA family/phosphatase PAP2 family protein [Solirubrobacterales bacterium]